MEGSSLNYAENSEMESSAWRYPRVDRMKYRLVKWGEFSRYLEFHNPDWSPAPRFRTR